MIATLDKEGLTSVVQGQVKNHLAAHCVSRCFEKLPGYVDIKIESVDGMNSLVDQPYGLACAICLLKEPESM